MVRKSYTPEQIINKLREGYPCPSKDKLAVLLREEGYQVSTSMVAELIFFNFRATSSDTLSASSPSTYVHALHIAWP